VAPAPAPAAAPSPPSIRAACTNYAKAMGDSAYPREAIRDGLDRGEAVIRFTVSANGDIKDITAVSSSNRAFARAAITAVHDFKCNAQGRDVVFEIPFSFKRE